MLLTDLLMLAALLAFSLLWYRPGSAPRVLALLAAVALLAAAAGVAQGRWQAAPGGVVALVMLLAVLVRVRREGSAARPFCAAALLVLCTLALLPLYLLPVAALPEPGGPYPVGTRDFELTDLSRRGVMDAVPGAPRRLRLRVWYPAASSDGDPRPYAVKPEVEVTFRGLAEQIDLPPFFLSHLVLIDSRSVEGAPPRADDGLPVVYFSHGYLSYAAQNTVLMETLASHGYLVVAMTHSYDAAPVLLADGQVLPTGEEALEPLGDDLEDSFSDAQRRFYGGADYDTRYQGMLDYFVELQETDSRFLRSAKAWLDDRLFVAETLAGGLYPNSVRDVLELGDYQRVAHVGMSFGGSTSAAACYLDERCAAAVNLDGGDYHRFAVNLDIPVPLLMLHSDWLVLGELIGGGGVADEDFAFNDFSYEAHASAGTRSDVYRLRVKDILHLGISDYPVLFQPPLSSALFGSLDGDVLAAVLNDFVLGFLDRHLRGLDNGFPDEVYARHEGYVVRHDASGVREWWQRKDAEATAELERQLEAAQTP